MSITSASTRAGQRFSSMFGGELLLEEPQLIVGIENGEIGTQTGKFRVPAQQLGPDGMERAEPGHAFDHCSTSAPTRGFHLARGLVGEGHREEISTARRGRSPGCARCAW